MGHPSFFTVLPADDARAYWQRFCERKPWRGSCHETGLLVTAPVLLVLVERPSESIFVNDDHSAVISPGSGGRVDDCWRDGRIRMGNALGEALTDGDFLYLAHN